MKYINEVDKFSILGLITDDFKVENGYYEFLLKYPEHPGGYNRRQQQVFPLTIEGTFVSHMSLIQLTLKIYIIISAILLNVIDYNLFFLYIF